jgi:hypothetical protein
MTTRYALRATLLAATILAASCGGAASGPSKGKPVSGRTDTTAGVSVEFPDGWVDEPVGGRPFTKVYSNAARQLEMRVVEAPAGGLSISTHGDQMKRGLAVDGAVEENGAATVDGHPGYRVVVKKKTPTGVGLVVGETILRGDRITTVYVSSAGDEKVDHRPEIDALLATLKVL